MEGDKRLARAFDRLQEKLAMDVAGTRENLIDRMRALAGDLQRAADRLAEDPANRPNSLGVVQGLGREVDRLCAVFAEQREHAATVATFREID